jgi:hypothetical protein
VVSFLNGFHILPFFNCVYNIPRLSRLHVFTCERKNHVKVAFEVLTALMMKLQPSRMRYCVIQQKYTNIFEECISTFKTEARKQPEAGSKHCSAYLLIKWQRIFLQH